MVTTVRVVAVTVMVVVTVVPVVTVVKVTTVVAGDSDMVTQLLACQSTGRRTVKRPGRSLLCSLGVDAVMYHITVLRLQRLTTVPDLGFNIGKNSTLLLEVYLGMLFDPFFCVPLATRAVLPRRYAVEVRATEITFTWQTHT
jgi:hypothetical protein